MKGLIFNIQRFSIHDGPGIRTTVFFKGCPLNCRWCANPESKLPEKQIIHTPSSCIRCLSCVNVCPAHAIVLEDGSVRLRNDRCTHCLSCVAACPTHALSAEGQEYTLDELIAEVKRDLPFMEKSGGGVTLSGGEPLLQKAFTLNFLKRLKEEHIHTVVETTAYTDTEYFKQLIPYVDLFYIDLKHPDDDLHRCMTDVSNQIILEHIRYAVLSEKDVVVRIPVIPRFNHSVGTAQRYTEVLTELGVTTVHLLPFHQMGLGKWEALGLDYLYRNDRNMRKEEVSEMKAVFERAGFQVQIGG